MTQNPVCWFEIYVQDMERARRFYIALVVDPDGNMIGLHTMK